MPRTSIVSQLLARTLKGETFYVLSGQIMDQIVQSIQSKRSGGNLYRTSGVDGRGHAEEPHGPSWCLYCRLMLAELSFAHVVHLY